MTNLSIESITNLPMGELCALTPNKLMSLINDANARLEKAKHSKAWLDGALKLKYEDRAQDLRQLKGKDTGTISFDDSGVKVKANLPKQVSWDQSKLKTLVQRMRKDGDNPEDYVEVIYRVGERNYTAWPAPIRKCFEDARTLSTGKQTFTLETLKEKSR